MTDRTYDGILAHAKAHGRIYSPALVTSTGTVIEGHTRQSIAEQLGIECPTWVVETDDPERLGMELNALRRSPSKAERAAGFRYLKEQGMSNRQIARETGHARETVTSDLCATGRKSAVAQVTAADTPTQAAAAERREKARALDAEGRSHLEIATELLCSEASVRRYLGKKKDTRQRHDKPPAKIEPVRSVVETPLYQRSTVLMDWREVVTLSRGGNYVDRLSFDALDALRAEDNDWMKDAERVLLDAMAYGQRLLAVIQDPEARQRGITSEERDDLAKTPRLQPLRAVR